MARVCQCYAILVIAVACSFGAVSCAAAELVVDPEVRESCNSLQELRGQLFEALAAELEDAGGDVYGPDCSEYGGLLQVEAYFSADQTPVQIAGLEYSQSDFEEDQERCLILPDGEKILILQLGNQIAVIVSGAPHSLDCE